MLPMQRQATYVEERRFPAMGRASHIDLDRSLRHASNPFVRRPLRAACESGPGTGHQCRELGAAECHRLAWSCDRKRHRTRKTDLVSSRPRFFRSQRNGPANSNFRSSGRFRTGSCDQCTSLERTTKKQGPDFAPDFKDEFVPSSATRPARVLRENGPNREVIRRVVPSTRLRVVHDFLAAIP